MGGLSRDFGGFGGKGGEKFVPWKRSLLQGSLNTTIKALRTKNGLSRTEFGKRLGGIPLRTIQNWESGERTPPAWTLELMAYRVEHDENVRK